MSAKGETWQFEADDNAQWRHVPDSADPLIMLRGSRRPDGPVCQGRDRKFFQRACRFAAGWIVDPE